MAYFISYSHSDHEFADRLAAELAIQRRHVWVDRWELKVGDSLIRRIEDAITESAGLIVILSKTSVASEWCKKELSAGLIRELEEKKVVVLPVVIDDCVVPLFLRDKLYADFRKGFQAGLQQVLDATAPVTSAKSARHEDADFFHDWAVDWELTPENVRLKIPTVSFYKGRFYSILTETVIKGNGTAASKYAAYEELGLGPMAQAIILTSIVETIDPSKLQLWISKAEESHKIVIEDQKLRLRYDVTVRGRRLGEDPGNDVLYDYGVVLTAVRDNCLSICRKPTPGELLKIMSGAMGKTK